ncbi:MAG: EAL domain-containing protein [Lachnospiraceae bacterium]|nr:EAL domain-containing protein [Lachnospiraceae bacterium]
MKKEMVTSIILYGAILVLIACMAFGPAEGRSPELAGTAVLVVIAVWKQYKNLKQASVNQAKMEDMNRSLRDESEHDELTGLFDRAALRKNYNSYYDTPLCTAMIDVDHFKEFNDTYGHQVGDAILRRFGKILKKNFSGMGDAYRYGGDEFLIMAPAGDVRDFEERLARCHEDLKVSDPAMLAIHPTMSAGYLVSHPHNAAELREVLRMTDDQLYEAKIQGRNRTCGGTYHKGASVHASREEGQGGRQEVLVDGLTGFASREGFLRRGRKILRFEKEETGRVFLYMRMMGLEHFRTVFGYKATTDLVKTFSEVLKEQFPGAVLGRFSEDAFAVLTVSKNPEEECQALMRRVATKKGKVAMFTILAIGIAPCDDGENIGEYADRARCAARLVEADKSGIRIFDEESRKGKEKADYILGHFREALEEERIHAVYQPVFRTVTGKICGYEAFSRWEDPAYGTLMPDEYLPVLEAQKIVYQLDLCMVRRVCRDIKEASRHNFPYLPVSVNVSVSDFTACDMPEAMAEICLEEEIREEFIRVEIRAESASGTESLFTEIGRLKEKGFEVWLDHFGRDMVPLAEFQRIPFDLIKIDMGSVYNLADGSKTKTAIYDILIFAKDEGIRTIGEHVEKEEQLDFLRSIGCGAAQGFYFGRPAPLLTVMGPQPTWVPRHEIMTTRPYYRAIDKINLLDLIHNDREISSAVSIPRSCLLERQGQTSRILNTGYDFPEFLMDTGKWAHFPWDELFLREGWHDYFQEIDGRKMKMQVRFLTKNARDGSSVYLILFNFLS